jgi:hypothetical protein
METPPGQRTKAKTSKGATGWAHCSVAFLLTPVFGSQGTGG